jgi:hypothetical protein
VKDLDKLVDVVWMGLLAGIGIAVVFAFAVAGVARAGAARRDGRDGAAALHTASAVLAGIACLAVVAVALLTMLHK